MKKHARTPWLAISASLIISGLLLIGYISTTFLSKESQAETLQVTATVPAPLPTTPAIITSPFDQEHVTTSPIVVSGTCGDGAYVTLHNNGAFAGVGSCASGTFTIQISLTPGANQLQARVYNITDNEGPQSSPITVYYDVLEPQPSLPIETSLSLRVSTVDGIPYSQGLTYRTSVRPTIRGFAPPFSQVTIAYTPNEYLCKTTANAQGQWTCTLVVALSPATAYSVSVSSVSPQGAPSSVPSFTIIPMIEIPSAIIPSPGALLRLHYTYNYKVYRVNELWKGDFSIDGGRPPYTVTVDWGDNKTTGQNVMSPGAFSLTHTYAQAGRYQPIVRAADQHGNTALLQLLAVVEGLESPPSLVSEVSTPILIGLAIILGITILAELLGATQIVRGKFKPKD